MRFLLVSFVILAGLVEASELKNPRYRNETIEYSKITVQVNRLENGFYEYIYGVISPPDNKGEILTFGVDLSCRVRFSQVAFPEKADKYFQDLSPDSNGHAPAQLYHVPGKAGAPGISVKDWGQWGIDLKPGSDVHGMRLISPASPIDRAFELYPFMDSTGWDYEKYPPRKGGKWISDFVVTGVIQGPGCNIETHTEE